MRYEEKKILHVIRILIILSVIVAILSVPSYFIYTRFVIDKFYMEDNGNILIHDDSVYVITNYWDANVSDNVGKLIGIGVPGKRTRTKTDYIWPFWIFEYKNDKEYKQIVVKGLMFDAIYEKNSIKIQPKISETEATNIAVNSMSSKNGRNNILKVKKPILDVWYDDNGNLVLRYVVGVIYGEMGLSGPVGARYVEVNAVSGEIINKPERGE